MFLFLLLFYPEFFGLIVSLLLNKHSRHFFLFIFLIRISLLFCHQGLKLLHHLLFVHFLDCFSFSLFFLLLFLFGYVFQYCLCFGFSFGDHFFFTLLLSLNFSFLFHLLLILSFLLFLLLFLLSNFFRYFSLLFLKHLIMF